jgi:hypothetical protein
MTKSKMLYRVLMGVAVLVTAVVHFYLGFAYNAVIFILNAIGFLGLFGLLVIPLPLFQSRRRWVSLGLIGYSALTILLWAVLNGKLDAASISAKLAELVIIITVWLDLQKEKRG